MGHDTDISIPGGWNESGAGSKPSVQFEHAFAEMKEICQASRFDDISFSEIISLGGGFAAAFSDFISMLPTTTEGGIYRCVFPEGVSGTLAKARDGSGALGTIMNSQGIVGQARWHPVKQVKSRAGGPGFQTALMAVAILAVVQQIKDFKKGQQEIIDILERDKKSQLLADYDLLASYIDEYKFYWNNEAQLVVNLNQVKNIKRNAMKDIRSYTEQMENLIQAKNSFFSIQSASQKIGQLLDRFVRYKLALQVYAVSEYLEIMLSKTFRRNICKRLRKSCGDRHISSASCIRLVTIRLKHWKRMPCLLKRRILLRAYRNPSEVLSARSLWSKTAESMSI